MKFKNKILNLIIQRIDLFSTQQGLFYEDGGFVFNSYDCSIIYQIAEGELLIYE